MQSVEKLSIALRASVFAVGYGSVALIRCAAACCLGGEGFGTFLWRLPGAEEAFIDNLTEDFDKQFC